MFNVNGKGEYGDIIRSYFQRSFPKIATMKGKDLLEILTSVMVGSKELRFGSLPSPENLVTIRKTMTKAIDLGLPIPVLVPWGGRKMDKNLSIDVAEVAALKQLTMVDECVRKLYPPGLRIQIRIEDVNAEWLYKEDDGIQEYSSSMSKLIDIVKGETRMMGIRESWMMDKEQYIFLAKMYSKLLKDVLIAQIAMPSMDVATVPAYQTLVEKGWKGLIPKEQRDYYLERYARMYPNLSEEEHIELLADYFAGSKVRYDLNGRCAPEGPVGSFIQMNFAHPVPGAPDSIFNNTLYYRTVPASHGRTHIAPWRAKGYMDVVGNEAVARLVHPGATMADLIPNSATLFDEAADKSVVIKTDYTYRDPITVLAYPAGLM